MPSGSAPNALSPDDRARLAALESAESLSDLLDVTGETSIHEAYFAAKHEWADLRDRVLPPAERTTERLPGDHVVVDGTTFWIHGITHADSDPERRFLREHVRRFLDDGRSVYCEQGIRPMYFRDMVEVCEIDDYRWSIGQCKRLGIHTGPTSDECASGEGVGESVTQVGGSEHSADADEGLVEDVQAAATRFREAAFELIHSGSDLYGEEFELALGDVASDFLMSHEDVATGKDFASFRLSRRAAENPALLGALQRYYKTQFLPQPVEREWLRRHDPELECVSHARNERMADYAVFHNQDAETVHLIVGAAHQPGLCYYLAAHRDGERNVSEFELVE